MVPLLIEANDVAAVDERAMALVQVDRLPQVVELAAGELEQVPLDAEVTEQRRHRTEREVVGATRGVGTGGTDVGTHHLGRDEHRHAGLDDLALQGIVAVAGPDALRAFEDGEVDATAARGATLELDARMGGAQLVEQAVRGQHLGMGAGATVGTGTLHEVAVHVPLDVGDGMICKQGVELLEDMGEGLGPGQVEHEL